MSTIEEQLKNGWAEEQRLVRQIRGDQSRLREVRKDRIRLLTDLCTARPLLDAIEKHSPSPANHDLSTASSLTVELIDNDVPVGLARELAELLAQVEESQLLNEFQDEVQESEHPEEWVEKLRAVLSRQHLIRPIDLTSEYAIPYLTEVGQRANDLFAAIGEWRRLQGTYKDPVLSWDQWFETTIEINDGPDKLGDIVAVLYRYGDLTSKADGAESVECDFRLDSPKSRQGRRSFITRVLGPATRSVGGESVRDQIRVIAQAIYEDACREAREMASPKPTKPPKKAKKGGSQ